MGQVEHLSHPEIFKDLLINCASKRFVVYGKKPFAGPEAVIEYLGQYTHRIAITNYRLVKLENEQVTFKYRDPDDPKNNDPPCGGVYAQVFVTRTTARFCSDQTYWATRQPDENDQREPNP